MPYGDPDPEDPLELCGVGVPDPSGEGVRMMAECFAGEFLRLGHSPADVIEMFRSPEYRLAHAAWRALGDELVLEVVAAEVLMWCRGRAAPAQGA